MKNPKRSLLLTAVVVASFPTVAFAQSPAPSAAAPSAAAPSAAPPTNDEKDGREHFLRGVDFSRDGDVRSALIEFRHAYELAPNYRVLYNIGQTAFELQDYAQSLEAFEKYLADGGNEIPPERRAQVETEVKRLATRVSNVTVTVNVPGAAILIDDISIGNAPLERPVRVGAGRHKFSASSPDATPVSRVIDLRGGEASTVNLELVSQQRSATGEGATIASRAEPPASHTPLWIGIGVTSALAIGTAVMGIVTLGNKSDFDRELGRYVASGNQGAIDSARKSAQTTALVFDILAAATIVSGGVTLVLGLTGSSRSQKTGLVRPNLLNGTF